MFSVCATDPSGIEPGVRAGHEAGATCAAVLMRMGGMPGILALPLLLLLWIGLWIGHEGGGDHG
jgi:hypothetical protein